VTAEEEVSVQLSHLGKLSAVAGQKVDAVRIVCLQMWHWKRGSEHCDSETRHVSNVCKVATYTVSDHQKRKHSEL
jgi:hypothetical protein